MTIAALVAFTAAGAGATDRAPLPIAHIAYQPRERLMAVSVHITGYESRALTFVVDTGARHTVIDRAVAHALRVRVISADRMAGAGNGTVTMQHAVPLTFTIGNARLTVTDPWILDLNHPEMAGHLDGLLGADFFAKYIVRIDPVARTLEVYLPETIIDDRAGSAIPLYDIDNRLFVDAKLTVGSTIQTHRVRIDTGSGDALSDDIVRLAKYQVRARQGVGLGQSYVDVSGLIDRVQLGPYEIFRSWGASNSRPAMGMELLRRFTCTVDVPHGLLRLRPNARYRDSVPAPR